MTTTHPVVEMLSAFAAGKLAATDSETVERHVTQCETCRVLLDEMPSESHLEQRLRRLQKSDLPTVDDPTKEWLQELKDLQPCPVSADEEFLKQLDPPEQPGELGRLGRYRILSKLGSGGMGCVFKALHPVMDREVALKVLSPRLLADPASQARFRREIRAVAKLHHANIVEAYDADNVGNIHFLVTEFAEGMDLARLVQRQGQLPVSQAADAVRQAALALQHAHEKGLVHRDIKPSNLLLTTDGRIKLLDLGLARICQEVSDHQSAADIVLGTPDFMAPEQCNDSHAVDIRADIYGLGCTLYFLLTGRVPFPDGRTVQKLVAHQTKQPQPLEQFRSDLPPQLVAVVNRMMAKNPDERFAIPADVVEALAPFARSGMLPACRPSGDPATDVATTPTRSGMRRALKLAAAAVMALLCGVIFVLKTARGTVEVHVMEPDVQVTVEDQTVTVDSHLVGRVTLAAGNHTLIVRRGDEELFAERFELRRFGHKVIEARWRKAVPPTSTNEKTEKETAPQELVNNTSSTKANPPASAKANAPTDREKPFAVLSLERQSRGEFKHFAEALASLQNGDAIEIHGNGPFHVGQVTLSGRDLIVRAAVGFRPMILPAPTVRHGESWFTVLGGEVLIESCDFRSIGPMGILSGHGENWQVRNCRFLGSMNQLVNFYGKKLRFENCLIAIHGPLGGVGGNSELELINNLIWLESDGIGLVASGGQVVRLQHNTFVRSAHHAAPLVGFNGTMSPPDQPMQVEALGNVFHVAGRVVTQLPYYADWLDQFQWRGRNNVYLDSSLVVNSRDGQEIVKDLDGWNLKWGKEEGSRNVPSIHFAWDQVATQPTDAAIQSLKQVVERARGQIAQVPSELGPDWNLVGSGEAHVRALAALRQPLPEKLPATVPPDGLFAVWRDARIHQAHPKLQDAVDVAADGDVLEIYSNDESLTAAFPANKRLHLRAAPGYRPSVDGPLGNVSSVEGIAFRKPLLAIGTTRFVNCSFAGELSIEFGENLTATKKPIEIINCWIADRLLFDPPPAHKLILRNSVVGRFILKGDGDHDCPVELDRCVVWNPGPGIPKLGPFCPAFFNSCAKKLHVAASRTFFESGHALLLDMSAGASVRWSGSKNLYCVGGPWSNAGAGIIPSNLDGWRRVQNSEELDSVEADPLHDDPLQWRLLPSSPGYRAGPDGHDLGADVDRIAQ